jgi:hypothetical protein
MPSAHPRRFAEGVHRTAGACRKLPSVGASWRWRSRDASLANCPPTHPWLDGFRRAGALSGVHPEPPATGVGRLRAGVVDADVAANGAYLRRISEGGWNSTRLPRESPASCPSRHPSARGSVSASMFMVVVFTHPQIKFDVLAHLSFCYVV